MLTFTPPEGKIYFSARISDKEVAISVADNGPGISPKILPHIFEPFVQEKQQLARSQGGLGIGLALVHSLVRLHSGSVEVESEKDGTGTRFVIRLPVIKSEVEPKVHLHQPERERLRVLIVEDNEDARIMLRQILELEDCEVKEACDGEEGLERLLAWQPQLALVDIGLPKLNGFDLVSLARKEVDIKGMMIVALTGYGMPQDIENALQAGFDEHLMKPVAFEDLKKLLDSVPRKRNRLSESPGSA